MLNAEPPAEYLLCLFTQFPLFTFLRTRNCRRQNNEGTTLASFWFLNWHKSLPTLAAGTGLELSAPRSHSLGDAFSDHPHPEGSPHSMSSIVSPAFLFTVSGFTLSLFVPSFTSFPLFLSLGCKLHEVSNLACVALFPAINTVPHI